MAANHCRAYFVMDDPWYSVHCGLRQGHTNRHAFRWSNEAEGHRVLARKPSAKKDGAE